MLSEDLHLIPSYSVICLASFLSSMAKFSWTSLETIFLLKNFLSFFGNFPSIIEAVAFKASLVSLNFENESNLILLY
jgi:hypothetical protein